MTVGILVITHGEIGEHIIQTACETLGNCPLPTTSISVPNNNEGLDALKEISKLQFEQINQGDGVLILTDLYGSTPSNIAQQLLNDETALMISGINLPMLIRIMNYPDLPLLELAQKALSAAHDGAFISSAEKQEK